MHNIDFCRYCQCNYDNCLYLPVRTSAALGRAAPGVGEQTRVAVGSMEPPIGSDGPSRGALFVTPDVNDPLDVRFHH